ncbi:MAG: hypothetical protein JSU69_06065 [Candidatus Zixiibacteriota bacterium]|nr:MAG: hypothetical protein JSU69_06065 [candidate division Zixibacteria bacterium]
MRKLFILLFAALALVLVGCGGDDDGGTNGNGVVDKPVRLVVDTLAAKPSLTDVNEAVWFEVDSVEVEIGGDPANYGRNANLGEQDAVMKAIKQDDTLYIWVRWRDASSNLWADRFAATGITGSWTQDTAFGEDKFLILFDAQNNGEEGADCATMCHATEHKTTGGGNADVWKWMSTKTNPAFLAEDEWWNGTGRGEDNTAINTYAHRSNLDNFAGRPRFAHVDDTLFEGPFLYTSDTVTLSITFPWPAGYALPGYYIDSTIYNSPDRGQSSMWDVLAIAEHDSTVAIAERTWTVVFARALNTNHADDVNLAVLDSVQVTVAATHNDNPDDPDIWDEHSGSKPFWIILKP